MKVQIEKQKLQYLVNWMGMLSYAYDHYHGKYPDEMTDEEKQIFKEGWENIIRPILEELEQQYGIKLWD